MRVPFLRNLKFLWVLLLGSALWALVPADLSKDDPLLRIFYREESFQNETARVPNAPPHIKTELVSYIHEHPDETEPYKALSGIEVQLLDFTGAEKNIREYVKRSQNYADLEAYYHSRLQFADELTAMLEHASHLKAEASDIQNNGGRYVLLQRALKQIENYGLPEDPVVYYKAIIDSYPDQQKAYLDFIQYMRQRDRTAALIEVEKFKLKFPDAEAGYLELKSSLMEPDAAYELLNHEFRPLWDIELVRSLDTASINAGKKKEYLAGLKIKLEKEPLDLDAVSRLFYAFYLSNNLLEAQNVLNDYRLLKEQAVSNRKSNWSSQELYILARLNHLLMNLNEAARFYYSLYSSLRSNPAGQTARPSSDDALYGLFQVLLAAEDRPIQISAANLDYYKDIARADQNPGILNGILSLILNGRNPSEEFSQQQEKMFAYNNRNVALRLLRLMQTENPDSKHLPAMYLQALSVYEKYGQNNLIAQAGEKFFKQFPSSSEIFQVAIAVADAYSRLQDYEKELQTYQFILPIAAKQENVLFLPDGQIAGGRSLPQYQYFFNRYVETLRQQKRHLEVIALYKKQLEIYPSEEILYERFAAYLGGNQLYQEEEDAYSKAIQKFKTQRWYEKLARWYLRQERKQDFEQISRDIINIFRGTEVETYLQNFAGDLNPYEELYVGLNQYAHARFPLNLQFVRNLLTYHSRQGRRDSEWFSLSAQYYFLDEEIRNAYLLEISARGELPQKLSQELATNSITTRFFGDLEILRSHFEEAVPYFERLTSDYKGDSSLNGLLADLKRSLGPQDVTNYDASVRIRERLARITPSDSALWTITGETLADLERYDEAEKYWRKILEIDPQNSARYLEVATILWDYYRFDEALAVIQQARQIKKDPGLYAYEAGAINESKRNYPAAIHEYAQSLIYESESAKNRLAELYRRDQLKPLVLKELDQQLKQNSQNSNFWAGLLDFYSQDRQKTQMLIQQALSSLKSDPFEDAVEDFKRRTQSYGFSELQQQLIERQIREANSDLEKITLRIELARLFELQDKNALAENVYAQLYQENPKSIGVIDDLLAFDWRTQQYSKAFAVYREVLAAAAPQYKKKYLQEAALKYKERKHYDNALVLAKQLYQQDSFNSNYSQLIATILAEKKDYPALITHYREGLKKIRESNLTQEQKDDQIALFRRGIIQANVILKDYTAALDQYIEIINNDAENETLTEEAIAFAKQYQLSDRLHSYYQKTSANSPKDHRWPLVLGRLDLYEAKWQEAIAEFQRLLSLRPERIDFHEALAGIYQRIGDYEKAIETFDRMYELSHGDEQWLHQSAELQARLGRKAKALELYSQTLNGVTPSEKESALCAQALQWADAEAALEHGQKWLMLYSKEPNRVIDASGVRNYLEALVRSGQSAKALEVVRDLLERTIQARKTATFDAEIFRSSEFILRAALERTLPELLRTYATGDQLEAVDRLIRTSLPKAASLYLPFAKNAKMAPLQEQILKVLAVRTSEKNQASTYRQELRTFYFERGAYSKYGEWSAAEWQRSGNRCNNINDLTETAEAFRLAQQVDRELVSLREYYNLATRCSLQPEFVERYLSLLYKMNLREELGSAASRPNFTAANYFIKQNDRKLAETAIASLSSGNPPVWRSMHEAMLGWQFHDRDSVFQQRFLTSLDLRTIGDQLKEHPDQTTSVHGDNWFYYGFKYGQYLWWIQNLQNASYHLNSDLEGAPISSERQDKLGSFYLIEKDYARALNHFDLALHLAPKNSSYLNHKAQTLAESGNKGAAIQLWQQLLKIKSAQNFQMVFNAAIQYEFVDQVKLSIEEFAAENIRKNGMRGLENFLPPYLHSLSEQERARLAHDWIQISPAPEEFATELWKLDFLDQTSRLEILQTTTEYLKNWFFQAAGAESETVRSTYVEWIERYADELLKNQEQSQALQIVKEAQNLLSSQRVSEKSDDSLLLLEIRILLHQNEDQKALTKLQEYFSNAEGRIDESKYRTTFAALNREGFNTIAWKVMEEMYQKLLLLGKGETSTYLGLAEIKLQNRDVDAAGKLFQELIYLKGENLEGMAQAAELLEKYQQRSEAISYRKELNRRLPWDMKNQAKLSEDLLKIGNKKDAAAYSWKVVISDLSHVEDRTLASKVYGLSSMSVAGPPELRLIQSAVRVQNQRYPASHIYYSALRTVLIEQTSNPDLQVVLDQVFIDPEDANLQLKLFDSFREQKNYEAALKIIDPEEVSKGEYFVQDENRWGEATDYEYQNSSYLPIEKLKLSDDKVVAYAMKAAESAAALPDFQRNIFFLQMSKHHEQSILKKSEIEKLITATREKELRENANERSRFKVTANLGRENE